jgi:hypothetical protein
METQLGLKSRVIKGNEWAQEAWKKCCDTMEQDELWKANMLSFENGCRKLNVLCLQLEASGWEKCLYPSLRCRERPADLTCFACPSVWPPDKLISDKAISEIKEKNGMNEIEW